MRVAVLGIVGIALMLAGSDWRQAAIVPGDLTSHHAQVLRGEQWNNRCAACHAAGERSSSEWLAAAALGHQIGPAQSSLCMKCHDQSILPEFAMLAHTMNPAMLIWFRAEANRSPLFSDASSEIACSTCHQEHHGADFDLAFIGDARCQACHTERYDHFAGDHPDFGRWPYERRTRISFDHAGHAAKHFATQKTEFKCASCHQSDATGRHQTTLGFDQACASCHAEGIELAGRAGFDLIRLPMLDTEALADAGLTVDWPARATGDFDGRLSPAMILLLAVEPEVRDAMARFGSSVDLFDADPDDADDMAAVATIADAIRQLADEFAGGFYHAGVANRFDELGVTDADRLLAIATLFPPESKEVAATWFGNSPIATASDPRWQRDDELFRLTYRPNSHADPLLKAWLELAVSLPDAALRDNALSSLGGPKSVGTCLTCHSIERSGNGELALNWHYKSSDNHNRGFTRFSHAPHTLQPELRDCSHCHTPRSESLAVTDPLQFDPHNFASDFVTLNKSACTSCHQPHGATSRCTTCHGYHVGGFGK